MTPQGPLARRIAARKGEVVQSSIAVAEKAEPVRKPAWLRNLQAKDLTGRVLS